MPPDPPATRTLLRLHQDALNRHDVAALAALYTEDAVLDSPMFQQVRGRQAIAESFARLFALFPDYTITLTEALFLADDQRVAEFSTVRGTHSVEFYGLPATGQQIEYQTARLFTVRDDQIVHERRVYDFRGVLDRLEKTRTDREMTLASAVQHALCRTDYHGPFCDFVASSLPCRAIGGDFVEYLEQAPGAFGFAVGDVAGKGPSAALVAAMLQGMVSIVATSDNAGPSAVLTKLNRALYARGVHPRFATLFYGVLTPNGTFVYSNAGHQPPMLVTAGRTTVLDAGGPILGVFDDAAFPEASVSLLPDDRIMVVSDGVTDATAPDGTDFGMTRLLAATAAGGHRSAAELLAHLLGTIQEFSADSPATDDVTIAVLQYRSGQ